MSDDKPKVGIVMDSGQGGLRALTGAGHAEVKVPVARKAEIEGPRGRAWRLDLDAARRNLPPNPDDATVCAWVVEAPWAHPVWHSYFFCLIHLRSIPGVREPKRYLEAATHEFMFFAMDPDAPRERLIGGGESFGPHVLHPKNFAAQITQDDDAQAIARVEAAIKDICDGKLSPDTDFQHQWGERFGKAMFKKGWR